jgi:hypothetical protein
MAVDHRGSIAAGLHATSAKLLRGLSDVHTTTCIESGAVLSIKEDAVDDNGAFMINEPSSSSDP